MVADSRSGTLTQSRSVSSRRCAGHRIETRTGRLPGHSTLQRALRRAPDGLPGISTYTIWTVLRDAGMTFGKDRSWCETGIVVRKRKSGTVAVTDPDATPKKHD
jgi:hypothetical protein